MLSEKDFFKGKSIIVVGHYGTGKTVFSANLAAYISGLGIPTLACDIDTVNPYFRLADASAYLKSKAVRLIAPDFANSNVDIPALPAELNCVIPHLRSGGCAVFDVGGDFVGASPVGMLKDRLLPFGVEMLYVINQSRPLISDPADAVTVIREIEDRCGMKCTYAVNNTNLSLHTDRDTVLFGEEYAEKFSSLSSIPILCTASFNDYPTRYKLFKMTDTSKKLFSEDSQ